MLCSWDILSTGIGMEKSTARINATTLITAKQDGKAILRFEKLSTHKKKAETKARAVLLNIIL